MKRRCQIIIFFILLTGSVNCQFISHSVIAALGNSYDNNFEIVQLTVGEAVIETFNDNTNYYYVTQGFQQPGLKTTRFKYSSNSVDFFPNPVLDNLLVVFNYTELTEYRVELYSMVGIFIEEHNISGAFEGYKMEVDFSRFPQGIYLIFIYSKSNNLLKTGKIIKL
jgi:hypothetical protein